MDNIKSLAVPFENLLDNIMKGNCQAFFDIFSNGKISINVPRYGQISNNIVFGRYLEKAKDWLSRRQGLRFEYWGEVHNDSRMAVNMVFYFDVDDAEFSFHETLHIPVSVMCEIEDEKIASARVYYSTMWIAGHNLVRPALLNEDPSIIPNLPPLERKYFESLWTGRGDVIMNEVVDPEAYFMGTSYSYNQGEDLVKTFDHLSGNGHNTELRLCSAFHDTDHKFLVVEYMNHRSGGNLNTPSSGMAIYSIKENGKIGYVRLAGDSLFDHCLWPTT